MSTGGSPVPDRGVPGLVASAWVGLVQLTTLPVILTMVEQPAGRRGGTATGLVWLAGNAGRDRGGRSRPAGLERPRLGFVIMTAVMLLGLPVASRLLEVGEGATRSVDPP